MFVKSGITEKEKERMAKTANYPWAEVVGEFEMTEEEKQKADKDLLSLIKKFGEDELE